MTTSYQRYKNHPVWETLELKRDALNAARFDDAHTEQRREDIVEWLDEAFKTRNTRQPALYISALDELGTVLNGLQTDSRQFKTYVSDHTYRNQQGARHLELALRALPLPPPKELPKQYFALLDKEVQARTERLDQLEGRIHETESALAERLDRVEELTGTLDALNADIDAAREAIATVSKSAAEDMSEQWHVEFSERREKQKELEAENNAEAVAHVALLAATSVAGEALAEHAAGNLSATDWYRRASRERRAAQWMRFAAIVSFLFAGAVGFFIVSEALRNDFDLTLGDGVLRSTVAIVIGAFGALLLREAGRHFRESDTAEDVGLSLKAIGLFYASAEDNVKLAARVQVGDAVLVKNILSRFAHRDAAKHAGDLNSEQLPDLVKETAKALNLEDGARSTGQ